MHTVSAALSILVLPALVVLLISLGLWIYSVRPDMLIRRGKRASHAVSIAKTITDKEPLDAGIARSLGAALEPEAFVGHRPSASRAWAWLANGVVIVIGGVAALLLGIRVLYVPMVSTTYQELYSAYCSSDAVAEVLSRRVGVTSYATGGYNGCKGETRNTTTMTTSDVFFLIDNLGLRDAKERSVNDMFPPNGSKTKNGLLAALLIRADVYTLGTPTMELSTRLAGKLAAGRDVISNTSALAADYVACRTAGLSAIATQQPYLGGERETTLGRLVLLPGKVITLFEALEPSEAKKGKKECYGDAELGAHHLGPAYRAQWPGGWPLLEKPSDRLNDAGLTSVALGWSDWTKSANDASTDQQAAVIAFLHAINSEVTSTARVRDARIGVNFFIGWERLAILTIVSFLALCLLWQQAKNTLDVRHLQSIRETIEYAREAGVAPALALSVLGRLYRRVGRSAPREIMYAALEVEQQLRKGGHVDYDRVSRVAEHELKIVERSRFFFLAALPLLPTIGFIGTVRSLIEALALADNIPRARDAIAQVAAVSDVTSTLSLCFSTTFMALAALLVLAPLDLWQSIGERKVIEEAERLLDPGL
ncbi:hypothetical protein [Azospirillum endophyticum]